jgi:hypothetical protein
MRNKLILSILIIYLLNILMACRNIGYRVNEDAAIDSLMRVRGAEMAFKKQSGNYGTLQELAESGLIDSDIASGNRAGYKLEVRAKKDSYKAVAVPVEFGETAYSGTGGLSFYLDESGIIRGERKKGVEASVSDPPLADRFQPKD